MAAGSKRRILLVIDNLMRAGAQRQAFLLLRGLKERGHDNHVLVLNDDIDEATLSAYLSVAEVEVVGKARLGAELGPIALLRQFRKKRPDVIVTMLEVSDLLGRIAGRMYAKVPVVTSIRARNAQKSAWWLWLDRLTMPWADRVVFNSSAIVEASRKTEGVRPHQVRVIPNGVEIPPALVSPVERDSLGISERSPIVLTAGRLQPQKRIEVLLAAMAKLPRELAHTRLLVAGNGPLMGPLKALSSELGLDGRVQFLGQRADMQALLALADVFVLPSAWEGMPNAVMEAMASGCPVIATRIDGITELIPDDSFGKLAAPDNVEDLATSLAQVLLDRPEAKARAARAKERVIEQFGVDRMVEGYLAIFEELAHAR